jgi:hypothetical protein
MKRAEVSTIKRESKNGSWDTFQVAWRHQGDTKEQPEPGLSPFEKTISSHFDSLWSEMAFWMMFRFTYFSASHQCSK